MVAERVPEPRRPVRSVQGRPFAALEGRPAIVTSLADVRRRHRELRQTKAAKARMADEIRALQARAEREQPARRLYWQHMEGVRVEQTRRAAVR